MTSTQYLISGDMLAEIPRLIADGVRVDVCITDPPYHLGSITKRFGKADSAPAQHGRDGAASRLSRGFMGWDGDAGDISFDPATWRLVFDILKPGGRLLSFGGTRTFWRIAAAIDAAGFEYEDTISWVYGQGLVLRRSRMKPCWESILVFRKPGRVLDLGIEECRVPSDGGRVRQGEASQEKRYTESGDTNFAALPGPRGGDPAGRWPGNLIHDGSEEVLECFPDAPGQIAKAVEDNFRAKTGNVYGILMYGSPAIDPREDTSESAARFFTCCPFDEAENVQRVVYQSKAKGSERVFRCTVCGEDLFRTERDAHKHELDNFDHLKTHPTLKPISLIQHLVKLTCPPDGLVLDPFCGTGTTILAAAQSGRDAIGIERDEIFAGHAQRRLDAYRNIHYSETYEKRTHMA